MNGKQLCFIGQFLLTLEAEVIESILRELDIPVLRQYPDSGGHMKIYAGMSQTGVSLYVPEVELDRARQAIEN